MKTTNREVYGSDRGPDALNEASAELNQDQAMKSIERNNTSPVVGNRVSFENDLVAGMHLT
jgi:hypothetical protein